MSGKDRDDTGFTRDLEAVRRGVLRLEGISDPRRREAVRLALLLQRWGADRPDELQRERMRRRVLAGIPEQRTRRAFADRVAFAFTLLAAPAPYALRALAVILVIFGLAAGATVASADSLPDEPLYGLKLAAEEMRLTVAATPEDRATVLLSIAEHRLAEAEKLAEAGREDDAIIATAQYGTHLANAAAELAQVETLAPRTAVLVGQLEQRLSATQTRVAAAAVQLAQDPRRAGAAAALAAVATTAQPDSGNGPAARIAANAAAVSVQVADLAEQRANAPATPAAARPEQRDARTQAPRSEAPLRSAPRTDAPRSETPRAQAPRSGAATPTAAAARATESAQPSAVTEATVPRASATPRATQSARPSAQAVLDAARKSAEEAKKAAERAKQNQNHSPAPARPTFRPSNTPKRS